MSRYQVETPPVEEFLPPPPDEVATQVKDSGASFLDAFADILIRNPITMLGEGLKKMSADMRRKRF